MRTDLAVAVAATALALLAMPASAQRPTPRREIVVSPAGPVRTVTEALRLAPRGARIVVRGGHYREPMLVVRQPVELVGEGWPVLDGENQRQIMNVLADDVTVRGFVFRDVGRSMTEDRAAIAVSEASGCVLEGNRFENAYFGIYLARVTDCRVAHNELRGAGRTEMESGNGIHLWTAERVTIEDNRIAGHRDGIYFEFVKGSVIRRNVSERNVRYGLHFMYSDGCEYRENVFRRKLLLR